MTGCSTMRERKSMGQKHSVYIEKKQECKRFEGKELYV